MIVGFPSGVPAVVGSAYLYKKIEGMWILRDIFYGDIYFGESVCYKPDMQPLFLIGDSFNRKVFAKLWDDTIISEFVLLPSDTSDSDHFGASIVVPNSSTLIISDPSHGRNSWIRCGVVHVFRKMESNWIESQLIQPLVLNYNLEFGSSVSAYGDFLIIGAALENKIYIYKQVDNAYNFVREISAEDSEVGDMFGAAVSTFDNNFIIGAPNDKIGMNENQGSVYLYSPCVIGSAHNLDFLASVTHSGSFSINTFQFTDTSSIEPNYSLLSSIGWNLNSQEGFAFQDGMVGANTDSLLLEKRNALHPCWLKKSDNSTEWEYIGGRVEGSYVYSTIPFNSLSQFILVDSVDTATNIRDDNQSISHFSLFQNYPNPFNPSTPISWQSPVSSWQTLKIYDVLGNEIATLVDEYKHAGSYEVEFDASKYNLTSGIFLYKLKVGDYSSSKKMILMK